VVSTTIVSGNITSTPADAIITSISLDGRWTGGVNHAIWQVAGNMFHDQLKAALPLADGQVVLAVPDTSTYKGTFRSVLFLADARNRPLGELVLLALQEAERLGMGQLSIPALRTGAAAGVYEHSTLEVAQQLCEAVQRFEAGQPQHVKQIRFVIFGDPSMQGLFSWLLARKSSLI
jgi:O-acetyl-ADP-ribose deacetylase (regulator of RNase III)